MKIESYKSLDISELKMSDMKLVGKEKTIKRVNFIYKNGELYLQVPRMTMPFTPSKYRETDRKMSVSFSIKDTNKQGMAEIFALKMEEFDEFIINWAHEHSKEWWGKEKTKELLKDTYKSPVSEGSVNKDNVKYPDMFRCQIPLKQDDKADIEIYDNNKNVQELDYITPFSEVISLVHISNLWFVGSDWGTTIKIVQMKVYRKQKPTGYNFLESDSEQEDSDEYTDEECSE